MKKYNECIQDCDECLKLDPANIKAMLRKCDGLIGIGQKNDAYHQYTKILSIDPDNLIVKKALKNIPLRLVFTSKKNFLSKFNHLFGLQT